LPRLVRRFPAPMAIGIMTGLWSVWHLPMFFVKDSPQATDPPGHFAAAIFFWSALHHLLQMGRPSVGTAMAFHAAANVGSSVFATTERSRRWQTALYLGAGLAAVAVATAREVRGSPRVGMTRSVRDIPQTRTGVDAQRHERVSEPRQQPRSR
jgi:membrane protease YdiL (CAAX protease family)